MATAVVYLKNLIPFKPHPETMEGPTMQAFIKPSIAGMPHSEMAKNSIRSCTSLAPAHGNRTLWVGTNGPRSQPAETPLSYRVAYGGYTLYQQDGDHIVPIAYPLNFSDSGWTGSPINFDMAGLSTQRGR